MIAICVDDEPILLKWLVNKVEDSNDIENAFGFLEAEDAIKFAKNNKFNIAFLDVELSSINGIELAKILRSINPECGIIFCTGHVNYAVDAISELYINGYLLKPIEKKAIQKEIDRYKLYVGEKLFLTVDLSNGIEVIDHNGQSVIFKRKKTEELLYHLIKRQGEGVSIEELCNLLWEETNDAYLYEKNKQYLTQLILDLRKTIENIGIDDIVKKTSNGYAVKMSLIRIKQ